MADQERENELRSRARERIRGGQLPCFPATRIWGAYGYGSICCLCEQPNASIDVEYELEHRTSDGAHIYRFHYLCHAAWQIECAHQMASEGKRS